MITSSARPGVNRHIDHQTGADAAYGQFELRAQPLLSGRARQRCAMQPKRKGAKPAFDGTHRFKNSAPGSAGLSRPPPAAAERIGRDRVVVRASAANAGPSRRRQRRSIGRPHDRTTARPHDRRDEPGDQLAATHVQRRRVEGASSCVRDLSGLEAAFESEAVTRRVLFSKSGRLQSRLDVVDAASFPRPREGPAAS